MSLIPISEFEIIPNKKLNTKSLFVVEAVNRMKNKNQFHEEEYENVICPFQLMLTAHEVANDFDNKRGNVNGSQRI